MESILRSGHIKASSGYWGRGVYFTIHIFNALAWIKGNKGAVLLFRCVHKNYFYINQCSYYVVPNDMYFLNFILQGVATFESNFNAVKDCLAKMNLHYPFMLYIINRGEWTVTLKGAIYGKRYVETNCPPRSSGKIPVVHKSQVIENIFTSMEVGVCA